MEEKTMMPGKQFDYFSPQQITTGLGSVNRVGMLYKSYGKRALLVTDEVMVKIGIASRVITCLEEAGIAVSVYEQVNDEPSIEHVDAGAKVFIQDKCQFLIALGGGSPIDAAKAIGAVVTHKTPIRNFMGLHKIPGPNVPLIAIPTTAGTGSEVTRVTIITDSQEEVKMLILSNYLLPTVAICDAELTVTLPQRLTAAVGLDALTHAIEAYISQKAQPFTDIIALEAIRLISRYLRQAWINGSNLEARHHMMLASTLAGLAFSNSSVALVHGMARPIGACFHVPHGISNAVLLPTVMRFTVPGNVEKFARIAEAMGEQVADLSIHEAAENAVNAVERLCGDFGMSGLRSAGVSETELKRLAPKMARDAIASGSPGNNPRIATEEEIIQLYMDAY
jgi:alcohol dehydrogenase class IV